MTDFNIDIDPATNLPKLPEGMIWNVREDRGYVLVEILGDLDYTLWIAHHENVPETISGYEYAPTGKSRVSDYEYKVNERVWGFLWFRTVTKRKEYTENEYGGKQRVASLTYSNEHFEWTPEFLLNVSFRVMEDWEESKQKEAEYQAIQAAKASILGTYPPKRREETPVEDDDEA